MEGAEEERVCGAHVRDLITGEEFDIKAKCVVNATGPFTDAIRKMDEPTEKNICQPSAGVHIVLPDYYRYCVDRTLRQSTMLMRSMQKYCSEILCLR